MSLREGDDIVCYPNCNTSENEKDVIHSGARIAGIREMVPADRISCHCRLR